MPVSTKPGWIDWTTSPARQVILDDLHRGILPVDAAELSAEEAWEVYRHNAEFANVVFDQFKERLKKHRAKAGVDRVRATRESQALAHDRSLFPRQTQNNRGETVFDLSAAKLLLRDDVAEGKHERMTPSQLQESRVEYHLFNATKFKHRIYQEVRRVKFINYMNAKREAVAKQKRETVEKRKKAAKQKEEADKRKEEADKRKEEADQRKKERKEEAIEKRKKAAKRKEQADQRKEEAAKKRQRTVK